MLTSFLGGVVLGVFVVAQFWGYFFPFAQFSDFHFSSSPTYNCALLCISDQDLAPRITNHPHTHRDREINTLVLSSHTLGHCWTLLRDRLPDQWQPHTHPHKHIHTSFSQDPKSPNPLVPCGRCETSTMALWVFLSFFPFLVLPFIGHPYNYKKQLYAFDEWRFIISVWDIRAVLFNHWFISILLNVRFRRDVTACCKPRTKIFCLH